MLPTPHDRIFKAVLGQPEHARGMLRAVVPPVLAEALDWQTLTLRPGSFVDAALTHQHTDLLYSATWHDGGEALVYFLFEHQSTPPTEGLMAFRLLRYQDRIWDREVAEAPNGLEALAQMMRYILEVNEHVRPQALQALLERELGPQAKDTIVTAGQQLIEQGRKQGIERSLVDVYEARFGAMPDDLRAVIEATHDEPTLRAWLKLTGTRGPDEIAAASRGFRAS